MEFNQIINSPGIWIISSFLVIISVSQAIVFMRAALREAEHLGIDREKRAAAIRSASITAIAFPIPLPAPVTMAALPSKLKNRAAFSITF